MWQIPPTEMAILDSYIQITTLECSVADLPQRNDNFTFLLIDSYSKNSVADQVTDLPHRNDNFTFLLIDSYSSELSGWSTQQKWPFLIPTDRFLP